MRRLLVLFVIGLVFAAGCSRPPVPSPTPVTSTPPQSPTASLGTVVARTTSTPNPEVTARNYLDAWTAEDYPAMYALLTSISRDAVTEEEFIERYQQLANVAALRSGDQGNPVDYEINSALTNPHTAQVAYRVKLYSTLVGDISRETVMNLSLEDGQWRVQWDDTLILPELAGGKVLRMDYSIPSRANIYDREGRALVAQSDAVAIGIDTTQAEPDQDSALLNLIAQMTNNRIRPDEVLPNLERYRELAYYLPIIDMATDQVEAWESRLANFAGIVMTSFRTRYYFGSQGDAIAPHVTGYMSLIQEDEVDFYERQGYQWNERVGRAGLELWGEQYLAGKRGGALYIVESDGTTFTKLAETNPEPGQAIFTTLDRDLQLASQRALGSFNGAVVVIERDTGRVLALASSPGFNPNAFEPTNYNSYLERSLIYDPVSGQPLLNRATLGQYPLGSVFKIVTLAAALESGLYTTESTYNCGYFFEELVGWTPHDWTWSHYQEDGKTQPSGLLSLPEGLMRSCNPWFQHIGLDFFNRDMTTAISDMARSFGLGSRTGIELDPSEEAPGNIPEPGSQVDAVNLAIGQGNTLVTPLQVARFTAAVGNGGTLYQPHLIERIEPPIGEPTYVFTPTVQGKLQVSEENLQIIHDAMVSVVEDPRGTARHRFLNLGINVAGKTGTAESGGGDPHAWFAGYTFQENPDRPDIAVVVFVENKGEGSDYAAPIFRRVVESYFYGKPLTIYWWEAQIGVERSPTPEMSETPTPEMTETPEETPEATPEN